MFHVIIPSWLGSSPITCDSITLLNPNFRTTFLEKMKPYWRIMKNPKSGAVTKRVLRRHGPKFGQNRTADIFSP